MSPAVCISRSFEQPLVLPEKPHDCIAEFLKFACMTHTTACFKLGTLMCQATVLPLQCCTAQLSVWLQCKAAIHPMLSADCLCAGQDETDEAESESDSSDNDSSSSIDSDDSCMAYASADSHTSQTQAASPVSSISTSHAAASLSMAKINSDSQQSSSAMEKDQDVCVHPSGADAGRPSGHNGPTSSQMPLLSAM